MDAHQQVTVLSVNLKVLYNHNNYLASATLKDNTCLIKLHISQLDIMRTKIEGMKVCLLD